MPLYLTSKGTVAGGTTWTGPYNPPTYALCAGDLPFSLLTSADALAANTASIAIAISKKDDSQQGTLSIEGVFSGAPGAFEIDLQTSDTDADGLYQQEGAGITTVNGQNAFRGEFLNVAANFARVIIKSLANNVTCTLRISHG